MRRKAEHAAVLLADAGLSGTKWGRQVVHGERRGYPPFAALTDLDCWYLGPASNFGAEFGTNGRPLRHDVQQAEVRFGQRFARADWMGAARALVDLRLLIPNPPPRRTARRRA